MTHFPYGRRERFLLWLARPFGWVAGRLHAKAQAMCAVTQTLSNDSPTGVAFATLLSACKASFGGQPEMVPDSKHGKAKERIH